MSDETLELAEDSEAIILDVPNATREPLVGLLLKTKTIEVDVSNLPPEANLRIALDPRAARKLAQALNRAAKKCLKNRHPRLH